MIDAPSSTASPAPGEDLFVFPASFAQRRLWFLDRLEPGGVAYNLAAAVSISGWLEPSILAASLSEVVRRHEALRTTFALEDGEPVQVVEPPRPVELPVVDLGVEGGEAEARRIAENEASAPFDLERGPLLRVRLIRLGDYEHRLVLVLHHIVADGRSLEVLVEETAAAYAGRELPELPVQYADYTLWQQDLLSGGRLESLLAWWREHLQGLPPSLELPADGPGRTGRGASVEVAFPAALSAAVRDLARSEGATVFMVLLAAFQAFLSLLTGELDLAVGVPVANRPRLELEGLIGFFVNTLVLRGRLSGSPTFRELLARVRETAAGAFAHQELPFERLVEELAPDRSLGLFQVMLGLQGAPLPAPALPGATARVEEVDTGAAKLDASLDLRETPEGIAGRWRYDRGRFEPETIRRFVRGLETLLAAAVADPGRRVSDLPLMPEADRAQVLGWSAGPEPSGEPVAIHERFAAWAERTPDAPALAFEDERLTYAELERRANRLAHHLRALGVGPESLVAIGLERSADAIVAILAAHKAGAAYLPLDPESPAARAAAVLEEARPAVVIDAALLDRDREAIERRPESPLGVKVPAGALAYVLYTSGSTGRPKGVAVEHRHLASYLDGVLERLRMPEGASWATVSTLAADLGNTVVFGALATGGCLHVISRERTTDAAALADYVSRNSIDCLKIVPSHLAALLESPRGEAVLPRLRLVVGGEACDLGLADRVRALVPDCVLINHYGPTEATVGVTTCEVAEEMPRRGPALPLGRPLADTRALVLSREMAPVPPGVRGEIFLGGGHVARGYLGRPDLTAEAFVPDPWSRGGRLYRTGDVGRWLPEGLLEFLGRADHQVKIRGFRVEPGEVEAALAADPGVARAVVGTRPGPSGPRLVAWVVPSGPVEVPALRERLGRLLPEAMVPSAFVLLDALPLTPNGKVDRRALPEPGEEILETEAPRGAVEELLASLWADVLGVERVGRHDSFFALGGHSLLAVRLQARVAEALDRDLPLRELFEAPTPAALAARLQSAVAGPPPVRPRTDDSPAPLSFAQERLWFLDQLAPGRATYNLPYHAELTGDLDAAALERALSEILRRHEVLRAAFPAPDGVPVQLVASPAPFALPRIDLSGLPDARAEADRIGGSAARLPFDLGRGPLLRGRLLVLGPWEHRLLLEIHHAASDAWSREAMTRELEALYGGASLPPLPVSYGDFAAWQREWLTGEALAERTAAAVRRLAGAPLIPELPADRPVSSGDGARVPVRVAMEELEALARRQRVTPFLLLLAAFQALLHRYSGQDSVVIGTPMVDRRRPELEPLIGFFVNTLLVRADFEPGGSFADLLAQVRRDALEAYAGQDLPFERLVEALEVERSAPLPGALFLYQGPPAPRPFAGLTLAPLDVHTGTAKADLTLALSPEGDGILEYDSGRFDAATAERIAGHLAVLLAGFLANSEPGLEIADLPLLADEERRQIERESLGRPAPAGPAVCLHELIEAQAARTPDRPAVVRDGEVWTYADLQARSAEIACRLSELGAAPETPVGVLMDRKPELVASLLGVLRSGAAWLPLDPAYPDERLAFMLADAGAGLVVTEERYRERLAVLGPHPPAPSPAPPFTPSPGEGETCGRVCIWVRGGAPLPGRACLGGAGEGTGVRASNLAYLIYTSGSTGRPKAVAIPHHTAVARMRWAGEAFSADELSAVLASTSICFDLSVFEIFAPLAHGGSVVLADNALSLPETPVTLINTVPSAMAEIVEVLPPSVRTVNLAGEPLPAVLAERVLHRGVRLLNLYGPSEDTTYSTGAEVSGEPAIGRPLPGTRAWVLDAALRLVPVGVPGELWLGGAGLSRGYLGRPDLTADRFRPDPFSTEPGARLYRTGDRVRRRADGELLYLGRLDHQVKIRGFRIEPGEVAAVLSRHPTVREAAVLAMSGTGGLHLAAFVAPAGVPDRELRDFLAARLPAHFVPSAFLGLDALPRTLNGKVDRGALARLRPSATSRGGAPRTATEELLAALWEELLEVPGVGPDDDFFALGGHSLLATRLLARVREAFGAAVPLADLFAAPTLAALAERIEASGRSEALPPITPVRRDGPLPLSFPQERLWFLDRLRPGLAVYNLPLAVSLRGPLDVPALERSLDAIVRRHEILRTRYLLVDGRPAQTVLPPEPFALPVTDDPERIAAEARRSFDLETEPPLRTLLVRMGEDEHRLLLTLHHIAADGWSLGVLLDELSALYTGADLPELPVQYADFAAWQRSLSFDPEWWRERLAGAPALELPADRPRPAAPSFRGGRLSLVLEPGMGRRPGATPFMVLLAGFAAFLARVTGQDDLTVGTPVAGRIRRETEGLIGVFVNTLPLRLDASGGPAFGELVDRVRSVSLAAFARQDVPFERVVEAARPERALSHNPLFQVAFALQNAPLPKVGLPVLELAPLDVETGTSRFDLSLTVLEAGADRVAAVLDYAADLFDRTTAQRMADQLLRLLAGAAPETALSALPLLSEAERHQLAREWNDTRPEMGETVVERFVAAAACWPDAEAVATAGGASLTFRELRGRALGVAERLRGLGVGPGVPVGLCADRTPDLVAGLLGIWEAGGAYVPLDPALPEARLALLLEDSAVPVVVADRELPGAPRTVLLDGTVGEAAQAAPSASDLAYMIYTSGTTGRPKAVMVEHGSLAATLSAAQRVLGFGPGDRMPCLATFSFDIFLLELLGPMLAGGTAVLHPLRPGLDVDALASGLSEATRLHAVPAVMRQIVDAVRRRGGGADRLRTLLVGGDAVPADLLADLRETFPDAEVRVLYGPTEATIICSSHRVDGSAKPLLGRPLDNAVLLLCDPSGNLVPVGTPGEIRIGGPAVSRGYWRRDELTAERYVVHAGERFYRSGDLARRLPDGTLEFLGRVDQQVKIRGFRIEPGEIEAALAQHPGVSEAVVVPRDRGGEKRLVAYVVGESHDLKAFLTSRLPDYMVPAAFVSLDALPLSPNGKVDRRALPDPEWAGEAEYVAPRDPVEQVLAAVWSEVLRVGRAGVEDDFFRLGGHSLLVTQVVSRVREALGVELPLSAFFEAPTLGALAARISEARQQGRPPAPPLERVSRVADLPLSFAQQRLWFLDRLMPGSPFYNVYGAFVLAGPLDLGALSEAFREIVRRHEVLRTTFELRRGIGSGRGEVQRIAPPPSREAWSVPCVDLSGLSGRAELSRLLRAESRRPFDLQRGPLLRLMLVRTGEEEHLLSLNVHHIVSDGWSTGVLEREFALLYAAFREGRPSPLPELAVQYADFAAWQRRWLTDEALAPEVDFWKERLAGVPAVLELPLDRPRPAVESLRGTTEPFVWGTAFVEEVRDFARRAGATPAMVLMAAYKALLARLSGQDDLLVGFPVAGRNRAEIEGLVGFFANTLALRTRIQDVPDFLRLVARVREVCLEGYDHQELPFERLVEEVQPERSLAHSPLVQVVFGFQSFPRSAPPVPGLSVDRVRGRDVHTGTSKFDLTLYVAEIGDLFEGSVEYKSDLFDRSTVRRLLGCLETLVHAALSSPEAPLGSLPLLDGTARHQILREWNDPAASWASADTLHGRFEERARHAPDSPALTCDGVTWSYGELNRRANRLAHRLRGLGMGPGRTVGLFLDRSLALVEAVLGVLKSGAAYLPLDPVYPRERLGFSLADSGAPVLLTQSDLLDRLPEALPPHVILLDEEEIDGPETDLEPWADGSDVAYVIYTSGSTGRPKGVLVRHSCVTRLLAGTDHWFGFGPDDVWTLFHSYAFDVSVWEMWGAFLYGGRLVVVPFWVSRSPEAYYDLLRRERATVLCQTPSAFRQLDQAEEALGAPASDLNLRYVIFAGEALEPNSLAPWMDRHGDGRPALINMYGITETTVHSTWRRMTRADLGGVNVVGVPIPDLRIHLLDASGEPVPVGVPGEIHVSGDGVAVGYLGRPDLTAARFVPDPFPGAQPGERMYRSGDLARWLPYGELQYLGRIDHQVKIRGFRIELGEIEALLDAHPAVRESVVLAREDGAGDRRLVAYVVRDPEHRPETGSDEEQVSHWGAVFDDIYGRGGENDLVGWNSTYTGEPIPAEQMREWLDDTVGRILDLEPKRVLEIGCGTGLILFRVAPACEAYVGTDLSRQALDLVRAQADEKVELLHRPADRFDGIEPGSFDVVVLSSVVQYFPGADYLADVVEGAVRAVRPGGAVFLGDLRSLPLLETFWTDVEASRAEGGLSSEALRQRVRRRLLEEDELNVDPAFFAALRERVPGIARIEVFPHRGRAVNELTAFRYNAVLHVGPTPPRPEIRWGDWQAEGWTLESLARRLEDGGLVALRNVPNARVLKTAGVDPQALLDLAERTGWEAELGWADPGRDGRLDLLMRKEGGEPLASLLPEPVPARSWRQYANDPLQGWFAHRIVPELRGYLAEKLPDYMVPSAVVVLDAFPLTGNGKVDRRALPEPERGGGRRTVDAPPRTPTEELVASVWEEVLDLEGVGSADNFFELGGDSIKAVRLVARLSEEAAVDLEVKDVFRFQTVGELALHVAAGGSSSSVEEDLAAGLAEIQRVRREILDELPEEWEDVYPLSSVEAGMVYYTLLLPEEPVYHDQIAYVVTIADLDVFRKALRLVVQRHSSLRAVYYLHRFAAPVRVVMRELDALEEVEDLSGLTELEQHARVEAWQAADVANRFVFDGEPLWRLKLFRLGGERWCAVFTCHHAILDGWSSVSLWAELNDLCGRTDLGSVDALPPLRSDYRDYLAITLGRRRSPESEAFWRDLLDGAGRSRLPFNRVARTDGATGMISVVRRLDPELLLALRRRAREGHVALKALCLGAHAWLLSLTASEADVVTGVVSHDRPGLPDGDKILGCFLTTLPFRLRVEPTDTGLTLARRAHEYLRASKAHEMPLVDIAGLVGDGGRTATGNPIFDTLFNFLDFHVLEGVRANHLFRTMTTAGTSVSFSPNSNEMTNTLFDLELTTTLGQFSLKVKHSPRWLEAADAERAMDLYIRLLEQLARDPGARLDPEALLAPEERDRLVVRFNDTRTPYRRDTPLHRLFEERAAIDPDLVAVIGDREWTYGELDRAANRLVRRLVADGVRPGDNVGVVYERSPEQVAALLAVLKAGAAYVPMEPDYPEARKAFIARSSGVVRVLTAADEPGSDDRPLGPMGITPGPNGLAYTIYTSGSTGNPKGVMIEHHSAVNLVEWVNRTYEVGPGDRILALSSVCFDLSVYDLFGGLGAGAAVVLVQPDDLRDPARLARKVRDERITFWSSVPSTLGHLVQHLEDASPDWRQEELRVVFLSGDWIPVTLPDRARRFFPNARIVSLGGATEGTVWSNSFPVEEVDPSWPSIPYGRPIANNAFYILDRDLAPVPEGVVGDLYIGGAGVARGYAAEPGLTARSYVPDRFSGVPGARLYRTGDLGRMRPDGQMEFLGRSDHQVKVRGFRVELGEIESQLARHPAVREAAVLALADRSGEKYLCAYVVSDGDVPAAELRAHLATALPEYMVPAAFVPLPALPLTPNGKLDRKALPDPDAGNVSSAAEYVAPQGGIETALVAIWEEVLGVSGIGVRHEFFELGGHSLSAVQVVSRIRRQLGVDLPLRELFESPTIAGVARAVEARRGGSVSLGELGGERPDPPPLSFAQQRLWFLDRLRPGGVAYTIPVVVRIRGRLDPMALETAIGEIVRRHEVLRTSLDTAEDGTPFQRIAPPSEKTVLPEIDLSGIPDPDAEARRIAREESARPFDLARGPLVRWRRLVLHGEESLLLANLHHAIADGWSVAVFLRELAALYSGSPLPDLPVQYADYAAWQRRWLSGPVLEERLAFWRGRLGGELPVLDLPGEPAGSEPPRRSLRLGPELTAEAHRLARRSGATLFMVLLAAAQLLLRRLSGEDDVIVGTPVAGRTRPELEGLIGLFLNNLALRTDLSGDPGFLDLLGRVREGTLAAFAHEDLPFEKLVEKLQPERDLDRNPVFDVLVNLLNAPWEELSLPGLSFSYEAPAEPEAKFALQLTMAERDGDLVLELLCDRRRFSAADAGRMLEQLEALLRGVLTAPEARIGDHPMLTRACRAVLPDPSLVLPEPRYEPVTAVFAAWAARQPDAVAVVQGGRSLTYGELLAAASRISLPAGEVVAVRGERSPELIAAITAVLASGGVLLLLDPELPAHRHRQMVELAGAARLLRLDDDPETYGLPVVPIDPDTAETLPVPDPDGAAYVFFTSGSTGVPKGVVGVHKGLSHFVAWERERFGVGPADRCAQLAAPAVDVILRESFLALTSGAALILPETHAADTGVGELPAWCERERITLVHTVPTLARAWLTAPPEVALASVRWLLLVGEPLPAALVTAWRRRFPGAGVVNLYGSTESNLAKSFFVVPDPPPPGTQLAGWPLPESQLLVVGDGRRACAVGEVGEIVIRTPFLSLGYLGRPEETAARFAPNPFQPSAGERVLLTGDRGRFRPDGAVEVLGRLDQQIKVRGVRVEPEEVAAVLAEHPGVAACAVLAVRGGDGTRLVACAVPRDPGLAGADLLAYAARRLPAAMVPSETVFVDRLPLTATGKLDRRALARTVAHAERPAATAAPRTPAEELVAGVWAKVLGVERVGAHDNFFALGGHSLLASQIVARLRALFGVEFPVRRLFEAPTVAALARELGGAEAADRPSRRPGDDRPLSFAQERMWLLEQLAPGSGYNIPFGLRLRGPLDLPALERAFGELLRRHEVLRAAFPDVNGVPVQRILPDMPFRATVVDLTLSGGGALSRAAGEGRGGGFPAPRGASPAQPGASPPRPGASPEPLGASPPPPGVSPEPPGASPPPLGASPEPPGVSPPSPGASPPSPGASQSPPGGSPAGPGASPRSRETPSPSLPRFAGEGAPSLPAVGAELLRLAVDQARRPFDLASGPLYRLTAVRLGEDDHALLLTFHHAVFDGWSRGILARELSALYRGETLSPLPLQYADYAAWQRGRLAGGALDAELAWWRETLAGAPAEIALPVDRRTGGPAGAHHRSRLPQDLIDAASALGRRAGATPFMVLLAAFDLLLWRWSGQDDLVVGTVVAHRGHVETEGLIGCFINFLPVRLRVAADGTGLDLLKEARSAVLGAYAHQDLPFEKLVEAVRPERGSGGSGRSPLYNVGFLLQSFPAPPAFGQGLEVEALPVDNGEALLDLRLVAMDGGELWWEYDHNRFEPATIERLAEAYERVLRGLVEHPEEGIASMELPAGLAERERLVVTATFTADPVLQPLRFWLDRLKLEIEPALAPYHQVFQQLLDPRSPASANRRGANVVLARLEDWTTFRDGGVSPSLPKEAERAVDDLLSALREASGRASVPWIVILCPPSPAFAAAVDVKALEERIAAEAEALAGVYAVPSREMAELYPVADLHDAHADRLGHVPYTQTFFTALGTMIVRRLHALRRPPYKVAVVDADNTLWTGVCGEDGPAGVVIDAPRRAFQEFLLKQREAGMLLCLCSKNEAADVDAVFAAHPDMPLRPEHVAARRVSWNPKSEGVRALSEELGLGLDSFVFLDDNPVEIAEVQAGCPGVVCLRVPEDPRHIPAWLRHLWAFDRPKVTAEDRARADSYRQNREREELRQSAPSLEAFLASLELAVDVRPVAPEHLPRVAQLTQRTNQLNLSLVRRTEAEVGRFLAGGGEGLEVSVRDRFGDYGLVGVALFACGAEALAVDTLLLSCRVLGRGVEHRLLAKLAEIAAGRGLTRVDLPWVPGERNRPALDFLEGLAGATRVGETFRVEVDAWKERV